jgi:purine-binding chemotaxis protein CheW
MASLDQYVIFTLDDQRYALLLVDVERIIPAVYITPLPKAPEIVMGIVTVQGRVIPVVNIRRRFRHSERPVEPDDQFIIAQTRYRTVALSVDSVSGVMSIPRRGMIPHRDIVPNLEYLSGVVKLEDELLLIHDLEACLSIDEERALDVALKAA